MLTSDLPGPMPSPPPSTLHLQPHGALLLLDITLQRVLHVSANLNTVLPVSAHDAAQTPPRHLLGTKLLATLRRELRERDCLTGALLIQRRTGKGLQRLQVYAYRSPPYVVIEVEPLLHTASKRLLPSVNAWLAQLASATSAQQLLRTLVQGVRSLTGHDRCLVHEFDASGNSLVVAEDRNGTIRSLLGFHFPSQHIPHDARQAYLHNPVLSVPDTDAVPVPVLPNLTSTPPSLALGALRIITGDHQRYLKHLGVGASLSVAIRGEQGVWGLLACHSVRPHPLSPALREAARTLVEMAAQRLFLLQARAEAAYFERVADSRDLLSTDRGAVRDPEALVHRHGTQWLSLFRADGLAYLHGTHLVTLGHTPPPPLLHRIETWLLQHTGPNGFWAGHVRQQGPLAQETNGHDCAGVLAVALPLDPAAPGWLLMFRREQIQERRWVAPVAALPDLLASASPLPLAPWVEHVHGQSLPWLAIERRAARDLGEDLAVAAAAQRIQWLNQHLGEERQRLASLNLKLEKQAHTDTLTGIWNRYRIEQALDAEMSAAERHGRPCTVLLFDIDHFKRVNDTHGHDTGDQVLATLAGALQTQLRPSDHFGRWGGEEFVVVLSATALPEGLTAAERLRAHIEHTDFPVVQHLTTSVGVAAWRPQDTRRTLIDRADQALYRAKRAGRNQVCAESDDVERRAAP